MTTRGFLIGARLFFAVLTVIAIITQLVIHVQHQFAVLNFFGYFTNLSNIFASIVFIIGAIYLLQGRQPTPTEEVIRGASVVAMAVVGIVFSVLLQDTDLGTLLPWVNFVVHYVMPVAVVADWLFQPPKSTITLRQVGYWLIYPLLYVVYTLIRGAIVGFYPYPFLNPAKVGGYDGVTLYSIGIFVLFLAVGWLAMVLANRLPRRVS